MIVFLIKHERRQLRVGSGYVFMERQSALVDKPKGDTTLGEIAVTAFKLVSRQTEGLMTSVLTLMGLTRRRRFHLTLAQTGAESFLPAGNGERMANKLGIAGKQAQTLLLRLDKQQFVERIFVSERMCKLGGGVASR